MFASPIVDGNLVFIGSCAGAFYALNKENGAVVWKYDITKDGDQTSFHGNPLLVEDLIITGTDGRSLGHVYAFEKATGKVRWKIPFTKGVANSSGVPTDLVRSGSNAYGVALGDELVCFEWETGKLKWTFASGFSKERFEWSHSPAVASQRVFFGGLDGVAYALEESTGKVVWHRALGAKITTAITTVDDGLVLGTSDNKLYRLSQKSGEILSEFTLSSKPWWACTAAENAILLLTNNGGRVDTLHCFDLNLKKVIWQQKVASEWSTARPFVWNGAALAGNVSGEVFAFRLSDGAQLWSHKLEGAIRSFGYAGAQLFFGTTQGKVFALSPQTRNK
ncbi:MAG: PQQ-binding-like beta-propeller repeat protein [candidate division KSB1 bacterium]